MAGKRTRTAATNLGNGVVFRPSPGVRATARQVRTAPLARTARVRGGRGGSKAVSGLALLDTALLANDFETRQTFQVTAPVPPPVRGRSRGRALRGVSAGTVSVETHQNEIPVLLSQHADGTVTWLFSMQPGPAKGVGRGGRGKARLAAGTAWTFRLPPEAPPRPAKKGLGGIAKSIVKVVVFKVLDLTFGKLIKELVGKVEKKRIAEGIKRVRTAFPNPKSPPTTSFDFLDERPRLLLFVHGVLSTSKGAFSDLDGGALAKLAAIYGPNIVCYDHWTLTKDPQTNAADLVAALRTPAAGRTVDVVTHSRGGLIARVITELSKDPGISLGRVVFVGTPNAGSPMADGDKLGGAVNYITNLIGLIPKFGAVVVVDFVLSLVKWVATNVPERLPGLAQMAPGSAFLQRLNGPNLQPTPQYAAVSADFEPGGDLLDKLKKAASGLVVDGPSDLVVPTPSVTTIDPDADPPPLVADKVHQFQGSRVHHTNYFEQAGTVGFIRQVLA